MTPAAWLRRMPWEIAGLSLCLAVLGLVCIERSGELGSGNLGLLAKQLVWCGVGLVAMIGSTLASYRALTRWAYPIFGLSLALLIGVYFASPINGAQRWLRFGPVGLQPSEFAKLAFVLAMARYLMYRENYRRLRGLIVPFGVAFVPLLLILKEPDLGTALVFLPVLFLMLFAAGAKARDLAFVALLGAASLPLLWSQMNHEQRSRVTALAQQTGPGQKPTADGYHLHQSKLMHALGGARGSWWTSDATSDRAAYHLPEASTDFIFCIVGERFGLLGTGSMLLGYVALLWRMRVVGAATREPFGRLVAVGILALFAVEVAINTAMTVGLAPITGLSLPLVSYGGSGLLAHLLAIGLLLNIGLRPGYEITREPFRFAARRGARHAARRTLTRV